MKVITTSAAVNGQSRTPDLSSPAKSPPLRQRHRPSMWRPSKKYSMRSYEHQDGLDRNYYVEGIDRMIDADNKWASRTAEMRKQMVKREWKQLMEKRERSTAMGTVRVCHPEHWNEETECAWIEETFQDEIEVGHSPEDEGRGTGRPGTGIRYNESSSDDDEDEESEDGDDEEPLPTRKIQREVKEEDETSVSGEGDDVPVAGKLATKQNGCEIFSLGLQLKGGLVKATKPFWGFDSDMNLVLMTPASALVVVMDSKRKIDESLEGPDKKAKLSD